MLTHHFSKLRLTLHELMQLGRNMIIYFSYTSELFDFVILIAKYPSEWYIWSPTKINEGGGFYPRVQHYRKLFSKNIYSIDMR